MQDHYKLTLDVLYHTVHPLVGLVIRHPPQERKSPGSNPVCAAIFSGSNHASDLKIGTAVATLPGTWHYWVSTGDWLAWCQYTVTG